MFGKAIVNLKAAVLLDAWSRSATRGSAAAIFAPGGQVLRTWADLDAEAANATRRLVSPIPSPVVLQTGNHPGFVAALLGSWRAGRPVVLADAGLAPRIRDQVENVLGAGTRIAAMGDHLEFIDLPGARMPSNEAADLYKLTSGTTSTPSLLPFTGAQLLADCSNVCESMGLTPHDRNFGIVAFTHSYGFSNLITPLIVYGIPLVAASDPLPRALAAGLQTSAATVLPAVPAMFRALLTVENLPSTLRLCISAGAPLETSICASFFEKFGRKLHSFYGASECGGIAYDSGSDPHPPSGFVGTALRGVELELLPAADEKWRLRVRSHAVASPRGFFEPPDLLEKIDGGLRIVGRDSDIINVGGRKVSPLQIEDILCRHPGIEAAVVFGAGREGGGESVAAAIVVKPDAHLTAGSLRAFSADHLAPWERPRDFHFVSEIPVNERGKVSRRELAARFRPPTL